MGRVDLTKYIFPLFLIFCVGFSIIPIILSIDLLLVSDYSSFQDILSKWYISYSYFANIIIDNLDYFNFSIFRLITSLIQNISLVNALILFSIMYLAAAYQEKFLKSYNKQWILLCGIYLVAYLCITLIILIGFSITTLNQIISLFYCAGIIMLMAHLAIIFLGLYFLVKYCKENKEILKFE